MESLWEVDEGEIPAWSLNRSIFFPGFKLSRFCGNLRSKFIIDFIEPRILFDCATIKTRFLRKWTIGHLQFIEYKNSPFDFIRENSPWNICDLWSSHQKQSTVYSKSYQYSATIYFFNSNSNLTKRKNNSCVIWVSSGGVNN